jgi:small-conductance mechanosensitive channel
MCEAAKENPKVDKEPQPFTRLIGVETDGLHFELVAWTTSRLGKPTILISELLFTIVEKFRASGIEFADSGLMEVKVDKPRVANA